MKFLRCTILQICAKEILRELNLCFSSIDQHYRPQMFLENLSGSLHSIPSTSSGLVTSTSSSNFNASGHTATSIHSTPVVTGGSTGEVTGGSLSDIISLD